MANSTIQDLIVEDFLAHHGVKGMKWGVRRNLDSSGGSKRKSSSNSKQGPSKEEVRAAAIKAAKVAGKYAVAPAVVAAGTAVGLPAVGALGISVRALMSPEVQAAASSAAAYSKETIKDFKDVGLSKLPKVNVDKIWGTDSSVKVHDSFRGPSSATKDPNRIWNARTPDGDYVILKPTKEHPFPSYKHYLEGKVGLGL